MGIKQIFAAILIVLVGAACSNSTKKTEEIVPEPVVAVAETPAPAPEPEVEPKKEEPTKVSKKKISKKSKSPAKK